MMKAALFKGKGAIAPGERPDPTLKEPTDAVVRVVLACVCGSDLWFYRGETDYPVGSPVGHEFLGVVEDVGKNVRHIVKGDLVIAPFFYNDGTCPHCQAGITSACVAGGVWGANGIDGGQGEAVRVPLADGTLVKVPGSGHSDETLASLLTLSDVMCTGHHAAVSAEVQQGDTVAVVGDGAVGLCAIIAAKRFGAQRIIALSRNPVRQKLARAFGATDILAERGEEAMQTALAIARPGSIVGYVGVPHGVEIPVPTLFYQNVGAHGGPAPARAYIPELLDDVLEDHINPGRFFDFRT